MKAIVEYTYKIQTIKYSLYDACSKGRATQLANIPWDGDMSLKQRVIVNDHV